MIAFGLGIFVGAVGLAVGFAGLVYLGLKWAFR